METRGIKITGSPIAALNVSLTIIDPGSSGNDRTWMDMDKTLNDRVVVYYSKTNGWVIATRIDGSNVDTIYFYQDNPTSTFVDPWDAKYVPDPTHAGTEANVVQTLQPFSDPNISVMEGNPVTSTDPVTGDMITTQTITYYNSFTNYRFAETNKTVTRTKYEITETKRYDTVNLTLGKIYRFSFVKDFEKLGYGRSEDSPYHDVYCGVYRVDKILSYKDVLSSGIDVYHNLYEPANVPKEMYDIDEPSFQNTMFYKLVDPRNEDKVIYIPLSFVDGVPDGSIARYDKLILGINLGVFSDLGMISDMILVMEELLKVKYGIYADGKQFAEGTELISINRYDDVYLTTDEYNVINNARQTTVAEVPNAPLLDQLFTSKMQALISENASLVAKNAAYERIIEKLRG